MANESAPSPSTDTRGLLAYFAEAALSDRDMVRILTLMLTSTTLELEQALKDNDVLVQKLKIAEALQTIDPLTGIGNRKAFYQKLEEALESEKRYTKKESGEQPKGVVLLMIDLNNFKPLNDAFGHGAGDAALILLSQRIQGMIRPGDTVARLGGDEFALILPHTNQQDAARHIALIQNAIQSIVLDYQGHKINFGGTLVAYDCDLALSYHENYLAADKVLIEVKERGRALAAIPPAPPAPAGPVPTIN